MKKRLLVLLILLLVVGCTNMDDSNEALVDNHFEEQYENMYDVYISDDNERISYDIHEMDSDKSLKGENLEDLSVLIYYRYDNEEDNEYFVFDFDRQYCFNVKKFSWIIETQNSIKPADEEMKSLIVSRMQEINAEGWWGETYDVESSEIKGWFGRTDYNHIWRLYFCFSNGDVVQLYGVGYDGAMYAPEELGEFLKYLRTFAVKNSD